jgi:HK97 family phage portal protein
MEEANESGLIVIRDYRNRAIPRDNPPNSNPPIGSVGPNVPAGFGDSHAMYSATNPPMEAQAWQGWPTGWQTPLWNGESFPRLVSTFWTCVDFNCRQLSSFPIYAMRGLQMTKLPEWSNNPEPSTYSDWTEAAKQLFNTLMVCGEAILWCVGRYADNTVARWVVLNPNWVNIERVDGEIRYELGTETLDRKDICHIKYQSSPGNLRGIGPLEWCAQSMIGAAAMEAYATELASNGGIPWAVLKTNRHLNSTDADDIRARWLAASKNRNGAPAILSGDLTMETLTIKPADMALLEMRIFDETRIAAALGVPPYLVGLPQPQGLTYANANSLFEYHWRGTLRTMAVTVAGAISAWALVRGTHMEFNRDPYVQATPKERAETYEKLFNIVDEKGNRAITVDEIRMAERYLPNDPTPELQDQLEGTVNP